MRGDVSENRRDHRSEMSSFSDNQHPPMAQFNTYVISWTDFKWSEVMLSQNELGYAEVKITGHRSRLSRLADFKPLPALEAELIEIAHVHGARIMVIQSGN